MAIPLSAPVAGLDTATPPASPPAPDEELQRHYAGLQRAHDAGDYAAAFVLTQKIANLIDARRQADVEKIGDKPTDPDPALAGVGHGMQEVGMNAADVVGAGPSKEEWQRFRESSAPLMSTTAGQVGDVVGQTAALAPVGMGAEGALDSIGARFLPKALKALAGPTAKAIASGAAEGAVSAGPDNRGEGAVTGGATAGFLTKALGEARRLAVGQEPSPAAAALEKKGVDLTVGQRNPKGWLNEGEQIAESLPFVGASMKAQREGAREGWQRAVTQETLAPGAQIPSGDLPLSAQLAQVHADFEPTYDQIGKHPASTIVWDPAMKQAPNAAQLADAKTLPQFEMLPDAFKRVAASGTASDSERAMVAKALEDKLSLLPKGQQPTVGDLQRVRGSIRGEVRDAMAMNDLRVARRFKDAEDVLTQSIAQHLPPDASNILQQADRQYAKKMLWEEAAARAKDKPGGPTPNDLSNAIYGNANDHLYARGQQGLPEMRELAQAGHEALDTSNRPTGQRVIGALAAPAAFAANLPGVSALVKGATAPQRGARWLERALLGTIGPQNAPRYLRAATAAAGAQAARNDGDE